MRPSSIATRTEELIAVGRRFDQRGWCLATSGNFSATIGRDPLELLITRSGRHKGKLEAEDFLRLNEKGQVLGDGVEGVLPSSEAALRLLAASRREAGAVLHTHSIPANVLTDREAESSLIFEGFEMQKALPGISSHEDQLEVPIFENSQDIDTLASEIHTHFTSRPDLPPAFLIRRHGLYAWGKDVEQAEIHIECLEFLMAVRVASLNNGR